VSITFNNKTGLLSSATKDQLWDLSRSNGLQQEYEEWVGRNVYEDDTDVELLGGILCIDPAKDLSLTDGNAPGVKGNNQLSVSATIRNQTRNATGSRGY